MQQVYDEIQALDGVIFSIGPETLENAGKMQKSTGATSPVLLDTDGAVIRAYKIGYDVPDYLRSFFEGWKISLPQLNPDTGWLLPIPATYVIDQQRVVQMRYANSDYTRRVEPAEVIATLRRIQGR